MKNINPNRNIIIPAKVEDTPWRAEIRLIVFLAPLFLIALTGCNTFKLDSFFASKPINIDGNYSDWEKIPALYFEDQEILLALSNDTNNLYMAFRFRDPKWLVAIRKTGLTIWLDNTAKKKEHFGIKYSGGPEPQNNMAFERYREIMPIGKNQNENRYSDTTKLFAVLNSDWWYKEQNIPADGIFGPKVKYGFQNDMYTYEFAVPLKGISDNFYGLNALPGETISIGLIWGDIGMKRPSGMSRGDKGGGATGGMPSGGMGGGRGGGGMGGGKGGGVGGRSGGASMMNNIPSEQKIWIKTKLAMVE